jgi:hypothetical protein
MGERGCLGGRLSLATGDNHIVRLTRRGEALDRLPVEGQATDTSCQLQPLVLPQPSQT